MRFGASEKKSRRGGKEADRSGKEKCPPDSVNFDPRAGSIPDSDVSHPVVDPYSSSEISSYSSSSSPPSSSGSPAVHSFLFFRFPRRACSECTDSLSEGVSA